MRWKLGRDATSPSPAPGGWCAAGSSSVTPGAGETLAGRLRRAPGTPGGVRGAEDKRGLRDRANRLADHSRALAPRCFHRGASGMMRRANGTAVVPETVGTDSMPPVIGE